MSAIFRSTRLVFCLLLSQAASATTTCMVGPYVLSFANGEMALNREHKRILRNVFREARDCNTFMTINAFPTPGEAFPDINVQ